MRVAVLIGVFLLASDALCAAVSGAVCGTVVQSAVQYVLLLVVENIPIMQHTATH